MELRHRLEDAARLAEKAPIGVRICLTTRGFKVEARRGKAWASRFVAYDEVELAGFNTLARAVQLLVKDAA